MSSVSSITINYEVKPQPALYTWTPYSLWSIHNESAREERETYPFSHWPRSHLSHYTDVLLRGTAFHVPVLFKYTKHTHTQYIKSFPALSSFTTHLSRWVNTLIIYLTVFWCKLPLSTQSKWSRAVSKSVNVKINVLEHSTVERNFTVVSMRGWFVKKWWRTRLIEDGTHMSLAAKPSEKYLVLYLVHFSYSLHLVTVVLVLTWT